MAVLPLLKGLLAASLRLIIWSCLGITFRRKGIVSSNELATSYTHQPHTLSGQQTYFKPYSRQPINWNRHSTRDHVAVPSQAYREADLSGRNKRQGQK